MMAVPADWQGWLEAFAVVTGLVYVLLSIRRRASAWIAGLLSTLAYLVLCADANLRLQSALQGVYAVLAVYGWWQWRQGHDASGQFVVARLDARGHLAALALLAALSVVGVWVLRNTGSPQPVLEALTTAGGLIATALAARKFLDNWAWWVVTNLATAMLYQQAGMRPTAALYLAYAALAVGGWKAWQRR